MQDLIKARARAEQRNEMYWKSRDLRGFFFFFKPYFAVTCVGFWLIKEKIGEKY